jgi:hypothetical protein
MLSFDAMKFSSEESGDQSLENESHDDRSNMGNASLPIFPVVSSAV